MELPAAGHEARSRNGGNGNEATTCEGSQLSESSIGIKTPKGFDMRDLLGPEDCNLRLIQSRFDSRITVRGDTISICGDEVEVQVLASLFSDCIKAAEAEGTLTQTYVEHAIELVRTGEFAPSALRDDIILTYNGKAVRPKTAGQKRYSDAIRSNVITFGIGPAGTGKTYLAMAMALASLGRKEVSRIILTRPVVEAGESLGYLPGTLTEKVDPYVRPLYDALFDMLDHEKANAMIEQGTIEIAPLAYMRGRTLNDSFVILDEAQNTTSQQMKMFLTRLGFNSKMVVTGDVTQLDVPYGKSGLISVQSILRGIDGIAFVELSAVDVVRHSLVQKIVNAYEAAAQNEDGARL